MADEKRRELLLRKRELLLKRKQQPQKPSAIENIGRFFQSQFPELAAEATGQTTGLVPEAISKMGAGIQEKAPSLLRPALDIAAKATKAGIGSVVPGGQLTIEKPQIAARTAALALPATRIPEAVGLGARIGVQQIIPPEETPIPGIVAEVAGGLTAAGVRGLFRSARLGNKQQVLKGVKDALGEADTAKNTLSKNITDVMDSPIGKKSVNVEKTSEALANIPENIQKKILKDANIFKIEVLPDGSIKPTTKNVWRLRQALDDHLTSKDFIEATKASKKVILSARRQIAQVLADVDPKIKTVMKNFSEFMDSFEPVKRILTDGKGNAIANKIISASKKSGEPAQRLALEKFSKNFTKTQDALKGARGFLKGTAIKEAGKKGLIGAGLGALALGGAKKAKTFFSGGE